MKKLLVSLALTVSLLSVSARALTITFHQDTDTKLDFEMSNDGPTPGDQSITSPSGTWGIYAFVHQFEPGDPYAEIGAFVKKLLPLAEAIGTDVILPQIYGLPDFPLSKSATGEFGDMYVGTFVLLPGSGEDAQEWDWVMKLQTENTIATPSTVPDSGPSLALLAFGISAICFFRRKSAA